MENNLLLVILCNNRLDETLVTIAGQLDLK